MQKIKVVKRVAPTILTDYELIDIFKQIYNIGNEFIMEMVRKEKYIFNRESRKIPPTLFSGLINSLQYYPMVYFISSEEGEDVSTTEPINVISEASIKEGKYDLNLTYSSKIGGLFINPYEYLIHMYILVERDVMRSQATDDLRNILDLVGKLNIFEELERIGFSRILLGQQYFYILTKDNNIYTELYNFLYSLEFRTFYIHGPSVLTDTEVEIIHEFYPKLSENMVKLAKILGEEIYFESSTLTKIFSRNLVSLYTRYLLGKKVSYEAVIPIFNKELHDKIMRDFRIRYAFIFNYGLDEYNKTGIVDIEKERGIMKKGNIFGDIFFSDLLSKDQLEVLDKILDKTVTRLPKQISRLYWRLRQSTSANRIRELLDELLVFVTSKSDQDFYRDNDDNPIICPHLVVYYEHYRDDASSVSDVMHPFKIRLGNIIICRICGEEIETRDLLALEYEEIGEKYEDNLDKLEREYIKSEARLVLSRLLRGVRVSGFSRIIDDLAMIVYKQLENIFIKLERTKIFGEHKIKEHKTVYTVIYLYVAIIKLSNMIAPSGDKPMLDTIYSGVKLKDVYPSIIRDINTNYSTLIENNKDLFGGKSLENIFLNAYKQVTQDMLILSKSITEGVSPETEMITKLKKLNIDPNHILGKCKANVLRYDQHKLLAEHVFVDGSNLNPIYLSFVSQEIFDEEHQLNLVFLREHYKAVSYTPVLNEFTFNKFVDESTINLFYGEDLHRHKFVISNRQTRCEKCNKTLDEAAKENSEAISETRNRQISVEEFYKKYSIICPVPNEAQLLEGVLLHQFIKNKCSNCGYIKDSKSIEFYEKYRQKYYSIMLEEGIPPVLEVPQFIQDWESNRNLIIELAETSGFKEFISTSGHGGSKDTSIYWLNNIGNELFISKTEMFVAQEEEYPRKFVIIDHIYYIWRLIIGLNNPENASDEVKEFLAEYPNTGKVKSLDDESITRLTDYQMFVDASDYYLELLIRLLLSIKNMIVRSFLLQSLYKTIMKVARYSDEEIQKTRAELKVDYGDLYEDETIQEYEDIFDGVDYDGNNDEFDT